jgi:hypothetical protein
MSVELSASSLAEGGLRYAQEESELRRFDAIGPSPASASIDRASGGKSRSSMPGLLLTDASISSISFDVSLLWSFRPRPNRLTL